MLVAQYYASKTGKTPYTARWSFASEAGIEIVRCCIGGDHRRVNSERQFSRRGTDRKTYDVYGGISSQPRRTKREGFSHLHTILAAGDTRTAKTTGLLRSNGSTNGMAI
jgi:hypothetical protein